MAPQFTVNSNRLDPYKNFKFRLRWDGRTVAGVSKISGLSRHTEIITHREGGDSNMPRQMPGHTSFEPITLERGVTHDLAFEEWANKVWRLGSGLGEEISLQSFRKDITLELMNEAGQIAMAYNIYRCWVSDFTALPSLDANGNAVAIQSITLVHEGWERDVAVKEPTELD